MRAIDADAFKDYIRGACEDMKHLFKDNADFAKLITESFCKDIDEQPTIQPEPHWIPVTERLPEYGTEVVTYNRDEEFEINHIIDEEDGEWFLNGAIAWMPLPEPNKGVTE